MAARYLDAPQAVDPIEVHINHFFDRVVACVNHRRMTLLTETNERRLEMAARVTQRAQKEQELLATKAEVERNIKANELRELQERMFAEIEAKLAEVRLPHPKTRLKFQGGSEELEQLILALGDVIEEAVPVIPRYQQMERIVAVRKQLERLCPLGVAIDDNSNHIYVAEEGTGFARVSIFSEGGEFLNSFSDERMKCPWGIAFHKDNVYVTDTDVHGVFHFKIEADIHLVASLVGKGSSDGMFYIPCQLAVSNNGDLFIADSGNHRIQILDQSLRYQRSITHDSMHRPRDVKLTPDEIYILSCRDSPCVHVFSYTGDKLVTSIIHGGAGMQVNGAFFFCLDADKNLIISDGWDRCIKVFSPNGTLLTTIGQFKNILYSINPCGIALMNLKLVVIAPNDEFFLQIFS